MLEITILTPTYNRMENIKKLWDSLKRQTVKEFEWLVVDDGSTDDTKGLIKQLSSESDFDVRYISKENGGKHTALNLGIENIRSELTFIVDDDDWLTEDAVASVLEIHRKYKKMNGKLCGYAFLRMFPNGKINGKKFVLDEKIGSYIDIRINGDDTNADKAEVFFTNVLKEFPFPVYPGEKFLGEDLVWIRMARKYQMVHINRAIYIGQYQDDGLTKNRRIHNIASPIGCMKRAEEFMNKDIKFRYRIKGGLQYVVYGKFAGTKTGMLLRKSDHYLLVGFCILPGLCIYRKWRKGLEVLHE